MRKSIILKIGVPLVVVLFIAAIPWLNGLLFIFLMTCEEVNIKEVISEDNRYIAQAYDFGCPAGTGARQRVKIIDKTDWTVFWKNKLRDSSHHIYANLGLQNEGVVMSAHGYGSLDVKWKNSRTLLVSYPKSEKIFYQDGQWQDVTIVYEPE